MAQFLPLLIVGTTAAWADTVEFSTPGSHSFVVPPGVTSINLTALGGAGGGGAGGTATSSAFLTSTTTATGGNGGHGGKGQSLAVTSLSVVPGDILSIVVGAGGNGAPTTNSEFPPEREEPGAGGSGNPDGASGFQASGGVGQLGLLSGGGGGAGGTTTVSHNAVPLVNALGGAGGGGGGAAFALDTTNAAQRAGITGAPGSYAGGGGACVGSVNPLTVSLVNNPAILDQFCTGESGGAGGPGFSDGQLGGLGGAGGPTATGGNTTYSVGALRLRYSPGDGSAGGDGDDGVVVIEYQVVAMPAPVPVPFVSQGALGALAGLMLLATVRIFRRK